MLKNLEKKPFADLLNGARITLKRADPQLAEQVLAYIQRDHQLGGNSYRWVKTLDDVANHVLKKSDEIHYIIFVGDTAVGSFHIHTLSYLDHKAEIGYAIEKGEEGKGYVSEAVQLGLQEMKKLGFNNATINCEKENTRSVKVAERNGFNLEGVLVQDHIEEGRFVDAMIFGKLLR